MKKRIALITAAIIIICSFGFVSCSSSASKEIKDSKTYEQEIDSMNIFNNGIDTAMPQTVIHKLITDHFNSPLPEGKKVKKAIFIGYDGFRADGLENIQNNEESAIMYVKNQGGLYHTFSGGIAGVNEQATSTAPSWMAMLTGGWGEYNGITDNSQMKKTEIDTFLTSIAKQGYTASFTTSWREHTELSYRPDIAQSIKDGLAVEYTHQIDDTATYYQILKYVSKPSGSVKTAAEDPDVIFFTLEYADHAGHGTGFGNQNPEYVQGCRDDDAYGYDIVKTIEQRDSYAEEDWLIVISTDHGGTKFSHGGQSVFERTTWLAVNKPIDITDDYLNYAVK
ncbi:MAG: alkaline phosphatase family protein [Eubacterium sp.]|nr:alkaline phosphatase family protein [Eubacterium sp.]MDE6156261.1 alkaline phosphatase family protein [Eubacterium sp.]